MDLQYLAYLRQERNQFVKMILEELSLTIDQKVRVENLLIAFDSLRHKYKDNDDLKEFAQRVQNMRNAQAKYFATRTQANLDESKTLERKVDKEIKEVLKSKNNEVVQVSIFENTEGRV